MTRNELRFGVLALVLSIAYYVVYVIMLRNERWIALMLASIVFGVSLFLAGYKLGKVDSVSTGFNYHLFSYLSVSIAGVSILLVMQAAEFMFTILPMVVGWGIIVLIHFLANRYFNAKLARAIK